MSCQGQMKRIDQLLLGKLTPHQWEKLAGHLETCPECERYYNRTVFVLRQLSGTPEEVSTEELAPIGPIVARVGRPARTWLPWGALAVSAAIGFGIVSATISRTKLGDGGEVQMRGTESVNPVAIRAYCVSELDPSTLKVVGSSNQDGELKCKQAELLQFAYQLTDTRPTWLYLAGVDAEGRVIRYYPRPPERQSLTLTPASSEQPLPGSIRLSIRHHPGVVKVVGLVTQSPLDPNDGDARVLRAVSSGEVPEGGGVLQLNLVVLP